MELHLALGKFPTPAQYNKGLAEGKQETHYDKKEKTKIRGEEARRKNIPESPVKKKQASPRWGEGSEERISPRRTTIRTVGTNLRSGQSTEGSNSDLKVKAANSSNKRNRCL